MAWVQPPGTASCVQFAFKEDWFQIYLVLTSDADSAWRLCRTS